MFDGGSLVMLLRGATQGKWAPETHPKKNV